MSTPIYKLPIAGDGKGFAPLEITASLLEGQSPGSGSPVPIAWVAGQSEPPGLLTLETPGFAEGNTSAQVHIVMSSQAASIPEEPVAFRLRMAPSQASDETRFEGGEVTTDLAVRISDLLIDWEAEPPNYKQGSSLVMPLLKDKDVQLKLKARRITASGVTEDDETVSFTHAIKPPGFSTQVFGEVSELAATRRELTTWRCAADMAVIAAQGISLPVECSIEIEARVGAGVNSPPKDSLTIPVTLVEPKAKLELIEPELPVPADGFASSMVLQVFWQFDEQSSATPASELELQIEKKTPGDGIDAKLQLTGGAKTDKEGQLRFDYTPPELFYQPGGTYEDIYVVYLGSGTARKSLGEIRIPLSPSIRFTLSALKETELEQKKFGIEFPEEEISIGADEQVRSVRGMLKLVENLPDGGTKNIPVAQAEISLAFFDGKQFVAQTQTGEKLLSDAQGIYTLKTPELTSIMPTGKGTDYEIPEEDAPVGALLEAAESEMKEYERVLGQVDDLASKLPASTSKKIKGFRQVYVLHLAQLASKDFLQVQSSARLFTKIVGYAGLFYRNYRSRWDRIWDRLKDAILTVIDFIWEYVDASEKIVNFLAPVGKAIMNAGGRLLDFAFKRGGRLMIGMARALRPLIERAKSIAGDLFEGAMHYVEVAERNFSELIDGLEAGLVDISAFIACLARSALSIACIIGSAFMALFSALASIVKPILAKSAVASRAVANAHAFADYAKKFISGVIDTGEYNKPWGQTMEMLVEDWGKWLIGLIWKHGVEPATKKMNSTNVWLDHHDPGRVTYAIPLEHAHDLASESPPNVPTDWEERVETLRELRRDQYSADHEWDSFALKVDYFRDILGISVDVGKTLAMLITVVITAPTAVGAIPAVAAVSQAADKITLAFKAVAGIVVDVPRVCAGFWAIAVEMTETPYTLYETCEPGASP